MAELDGKPNPEMFRSAFKLFEETAREMDQMQTKLDELVVIYKRGQPVKVFEDSVSKIYKEMDDIERVSLRGGRFSNIATGQKPPASARPTNLLEAMEAQRADLILLRKQLGETLDTFRAVVPLAEKKQFVPMMLSGRAGFSSKVQQAVHLLGVYSRFYMRTCMGTIEATMQAYPAGFDWLPKVPDSVGPIPTMEPLPTLVPTGAPATNTATAEPSPTAPPVAAPGVTTKSTAGGSSGSSGCSFHSELSRNKGGPMLLAGSLLLELARRARRRSKGTGAG